MSDQVAKKPGVDGTRIGDYAAMQPLSGIALVDETTAVNGLGRGGFVRKEETEPSKSRRAR